MPAPPSPGSTPFTVPHRIALLSIVGFWLFYFVSVSVRALILARPGYNAETMDNRALVSLCGMGFTWLLYLALERLSRRTLRVRVVAAFLLSAVCATAYASVNYVSYYVHDPLPAELTGDKKLEEREPKSPAKMIAEGAIGWYFFVLAWSVFYLALSYAGAVRNSEREAARLRAAAQTAELRALRYQVNPHFLFNTLNSISALVMSDKRAQAEAMILNLSTFFRTSLAAEPTEDVPLADEIAIQKLYLEIEAVRFPDRLRSSFDVEPQAELACVPGLLLQPLIENAVKYGVAPAKRPVTIHLTARTEGDRLCITVCDDGDGAPCPNGTGVGLRNVSDRLAARFGDAAGLTAASHPDGGFRATLTLPLVTNGC